MQQMPKKCSLHMFLYQFAQFSHRLFPSWWDKYENVCVFESLYLPRVMVASVTPNKRGHTDLCRFGGEIYLLRIDSGKKFQSNILRFLCFHTVCIVCGYNEHLNFTTSRSVATRAVFLQTKLIFQLYIFPLTAESRHKKSVLCVLRKSLPPLSESVCLCTLDYQFIYIMCFY